jgi:rSAM/selenodomain-associated transferase 1
MTENSGWTYPQARILVFGKAPFPGQVKTRLAAAIGDEEAARSYAHWLEQHIRTLVSDQLAPVELWVSPDTRHPLFKKLRDTLGVSIHQQPTGDLGQRMRKVFQYSLARCESAVLTGSDCPVMRPDYVNRALKALAADIDVVFGPAEDGGYVLVGQNCAHPSLFSEIPWSTDEVLHKTRLRLLAEHQGWAELETLWDIDTVDDYRRWQSINRLQPGQQDNVNSRNQEVNFP